MASASGGTSRVTVVPVATEASRPIVTGATLCESLREGDFELVAMDVASARVGTIDEALAVIRDGVTTTMAN